MAVLQSFNIALEKEGEKRKKSYHNTGYSYLVTQPSTTRSEQDLTLLSGQIMLLSLWYIDYTELFFLICKMR